ncbi:branched-chain amino acid ABC transporter permease [Alsobacter sp. R-9]
MLGQAIADGILTGAIIALGAIGVSFGLQILRFANFAHSELVTWGAYLALVVVAFAGPGTPTGPLSFGWQLIAAMVIAGVLTGGLAWLVDILVFRRLRNSGAHPLSMVFAAFGAALIMRHVIVLIWGHGSYFYTRELQIAVQVLPGIRMLPDQIFILGLTVVVVVGMHLYLTYSRTGMAMRAMAESPALAQVCGVQVESVVRWTWFISGGLAAMAGVFLGLTPQIHPEMGFNLLLALFAAAILGGAGSLVGAVVGGLLVGLAENLSVLVISPGYKTAMPFLVLLAVLFVRPQGLFGEKQ